MLIGRLLLAIVTIMLSTFILAAVTTITTDENDQSTNYPNVNNTNDDPYAYQKQQQSELLVLPVRSSSAADQNECQQPCSIDYCLQYISFNKNCSKLIRDQCDCCTVCLRTENETCGGRFNVFGLCEQDFICIQPTEKKNSIEQTGICVKACLKFQCWPVTINNKTSCQCGNRRVPCDVNLRLNMTNITNENNNHYHKNNDSNIRAACEEQLTLRQRYELRSLKTNEVTPSINCSNIICDNTPVNSSFCPSDSYFVPDHSSSSCCSSPTGHCVCSPCPKTICGENSIIQIYRSGNSNLPGQCCNQFNCIKNSKQCYQNKKIYGENETWSLDHCTTCICRSGLIDCEMVQCPIDTHCGYMYKPENECCPKCGGCLNDRLHVQHMNSTWIESNGCMRCWCENGRSRCIAEGCIAPPCDNPRQIANICCPVCDDESEHSIDEHDLAIHSPIPKCSPLIECFLACEHGLAKDEQGCVQCACSTMSCPSPLCTLKFNISTQQYCSCSPPLGSKCARLNCDKHCPYNYSIDIETGCLQCACNPCPALICTKNCTYGLKRNEIGCSICVCESSAKNSELTTYNNTSNFEAISRAWPRQCQSGSFSYSNGEIWFDGCRQCLCHRGEQLCALISCPVPKCAKPVLLSNRCCPSCPESPMALEPIPSSQVCYASAYVTGEELEFDKCTKCLCLHNIAFCSESLCPPLRCSSPVYDSSLCCPVCPPSSSSLPAIDSAISTTDEDVCILENGLTKHAGELWKRNDCQSCLCPRGGGGQIECFSQTCTQNLPCSNPVLKKGQCCPFCLPPTAAIAVCIFNYVQYRSGEHWNVSDCHRCECSFGTIVCHQHKCPVLTCIHTVTLSGNCCPICRDQLPFISSQGKVPISQSGFGVTIIIIFAILILVLVLIITILLIVLLRGGSRRRSSSEQLPTINRHSPMTHHHHHHTTTIGLKNADIFSYVKYDRISISNETNTGNNNNNNNKQGLSLSSTMPLTAIEQASTHSINGTNTTTTGTTSSNNELEPITWTEDDVLMMQCSGSSNGDDEEEEEQEMISTIDNDESHQQQAPRAQIQMITGPPTIIYV